MASVIQRKKAFKFLSTLEREFGLALDASKIAD